MKITIETDDLKTIVEVKEMRCALPEVLHAIKGMLVTAGYHPHCVDDSIDKDSAWSWFPDRAVTSCEDDC